MTDDDRGEQLLTRLAVPGERLGWIYVHRELYCRKYPKPAPEPGTREAAARKHLNRVRESAPRWMYNATRVGAGVSVALGFIVLITDRDLDSLPDLILMVIVLASLWALLFAVLTGLRLLVSRLDIPISRAVDRVLHRGALKRWNRRRLKHESRQRKSVESMLEWTAAAPGPGNRPLHVVGGTPYGWEALLVVLGGSLLATRGPMTLVDFTGDAVSDDLIRLARTTGRTVVERRLPDELTRFDPVGGLSPDELVTCLVEAMHGDAQGADRAGRSQDTLLLTEVCQALAPTLSMARLLAAVRVLLDRPAQAVLSGEETDRLLDLHPDESRRQMHTALRRIEAFLHPLETMGSDPAEPVESDLFCLLVDDDGRSARRELLQEIVVQWLARQVRPMRRDRTPRGSLILVGADDVHHRALEQLGGLCERRGLRLVLLSAHLREETVRAIGGGEVAFMRLGNHHEAAQAADFIGKGHRFIISQRTRTLGRYQTHTETESAGVTATDGVTSGSSRLVLLQGIHRGSSASYTESRQESESLSEGRSRSEAETTQRVYEYAVEPRALQDLPDHAMLIVQQHDDGAVVRAVEVNPEIATLPRMSMDPVELPPLPAPDEALHQVDEQIRPGT
jgi:hypothetical protein